MMISVAGRGRLKGVEELLVVFFLLEFTVSVASFSYYGGDDYGQDYGGGGRDYGSYDYGQPRKPEYTPAPRFKCFVCHVIYKPTESIQGYSNCYVPFSPDGIDTLECTSYCAITTTRKEDDAIQLVRSCLPGCVEERDSHSETTCCVGNYCNGNGQNTIHSVHRGLITFLGLTAYIIRKLS